MYDGSQAIQVPLGVSVFGSALVQVAPDRCSLAFSVAKEAKTPKDAFSITRKAAGEVSRYLRDSAIGDVRASRTSLDENHGPGGLLGRRAAYVARVGYLVVVEDMDRVEEILAGVVDAGVDEVHFTSYESSRLGEVRAEARDKAVRAATEKARAYAASAGVELGGVLHIEDVNPEVVGGRAFGHVPSGVQQGEPASGFADPGSITVAGAVRMAFAIRSDS